ncbi:alpha/beta fold hydrolase [Streptomyces sp. NPDC127084]|uniref:alpha/beta fold hydrolase n=1 Tax=Streptomyces sp. NPDC127084 TaxID=3347133 RepID=UPI003651EB35
MSTDHYASLPSGVRICYRTRGSSDGDPLLLIAGLGQDLTCWPRAFLDGLAERGFLVIHYDNRDIGRSTPMRTPTASRLDQLRGRPKPGAYRLNDMAADGVGLLDHLGIERAHVVGQSLGGMIAQTLAVSFPSRVKTLTSIYSTTGRPGVGRPTWSTKLRVVAGRPAHTRQAAVKRYLSMISHLAGPGYPIDRELETAYAQGAWNRRNHAGREGISRQLQAVQASGDRTAQLRTITVPTLVIHGDVDPMVNPSGAHATAEAIPGSRLEIVPGMGHHLAPGLIDRVLTLITEHSQESISP